MLTPDFGEELENVGFPVALNLMEKSACRGERIDLSGKGLGEGLLLCFSTGTHCLVSLWRLLCLLEGGHPLCIDTTCMDVTLLVLGWTLAKITCV